MVPEQLIPICRRTRAWHLAVALLLCTGCAGTVDTQPAGTPGPPADPSVTQPGAPAQPPGAEPEDRAADPSGATLALMQQSQRAATSGQVLEAIAYTERAIRLNPRRADLWIRLAELELTNEQPATAIQYANKALSLLEDASHLQRDAWLVIADAREALGDNAEAAAIRGRWQTYRG